MPSEKDTKNPSGISKKIGISIGISPIIITLMLVTSMVPLCIYTANSYKQSIDHIMVSASKQLENEGRSNANRVSHWLADQQTKVKLLAAEPALTGPSNTNVIEPFLTDITHSSSDVIAAVTIGPDGKQIARSDTEEKSNVADSRYFSDIMKGAKSSVSISRAPTSLKGTIYVSAPVKIPSQTEPISVLAISSSVNDNVIGKTFGKTGFSYLVDKTGLILAHPLSNKAGKKLDTAIIKLLEDTSPGKSHKINTKEGASVVAVANKIVGNLYLVTQMDSMEIYEPINDLQFRALFSMFVGVVVAAVLASILSAGLKRRMTKISRLTLRVKHIRSVEEIERIEDEIEDVGGAKELRELACAIKKLIVASKIIYARSQATTT